MENPKVFLSHANDDKDRFVRGFATKLRLRGIDAWVDEWEIYPGDSLVQKIFNEGIKGAQAVIVVLSTYSVNKPWVREEIDAAFVARVNQGSKLLPVLIDDCEVPPALQSTAWQRILNLSNYEKEFDRIMVAILGGTQKPALGALPNYIETVLETFPALSKIDALVLTFACKLALERERPAARVRSVTLMQRLVAEGVSEEQFQESMEILNNRGHLNGTTFIGGIVGLFSVPYRTLDEYLRTILPNYPDLVNQVALEVVNHGIHSAETIAQKLQQPALYISNIFEDMEARGFVTLSRPIDGHWRVRQISAELRRRLRDDF